MASPETADRGKTRSDVSGFDILDEIPARNLSKKSENSMYSFEQKHVFSMKVHALSFSVYIIFHSSLISTFYSSSPLFIRGS